MATTLLSKTAPNYQTKTGQTDSIYVPQPFLNYAGLTKMLSGNYHYVPKEPQNLDGSETNKNQNCDNTLNKQNNKKKKIHFLLQINQIKIKQLKQKENNLKKKTPLDFG